MCGLSLVAGNRDCSCRVVVYEVLIAVASLVADRLSCLMVCDLPGPRIEPMSPALAGEFLTTGLPRKSQQ